MSMDRKRIYREFTHKEAVFRICCDKYEIVTDEIVRQRRILEEYICRHADFLESFVPVKLLSDAPDVAKRMASAAELVGVGPMAAVAGVMAQLAVEAGIRAGSSETIVENGGDIYLKATRPVTICIYTGEGKLSQKLGLSLEANETPISICSSSGKMGHSKSMGQCDLATVVSKDAALADAAATQAANLVNKVEDIEEALNRINAIKGIEGVLIVKDEKIGLAGKLPALVKLT